MESPSRAEVKGVLAFGEGQAPDRSLEGFTRPDPDNFGFNAQIFIGQTGDDMSDSFDVVVCSPSWFASQVAQGNWDRFKGGGLRELPESIVVGSGLWFMRRWEATAFMDALARVCDTLGPGPDWGSVASRIGRLIPWEFCL
jgi:hypothetical protein